MISNFQTGVKIPDYSWKTGYKHITVLMGSCFTENIGNIMSALKYPVNLNPFGILYNPISIAQALEFIIQNKPFQESDLNQHDGLWHSLYHHGKFSSSNKSKTLSDINEGLESASSFLQRAEFLFLSFGTAWVYEYKATGQIVSNCHKMPDSNFKRFRLTPGEIVDVYRTLLPALWKLNPGLKVIFTVSPIRHWKDGAIENQRSKATLILSIDQIIRGFGEERCNYFPSYEIVMDELRDYRFYNEDMIHLSTSAVNHIWKIFQKSLIDEASIELSKKVQKITDTLNHKPRNMFTQEHLSFLKESLKKAYQLHEENPYLDLTFEIECISDRIKKTTGNNRTNELS